MTVYYQLENMLVAGFKSQDEYDRYQALKRDYEGESEDYSFSIREITNQLEIICQTSENDFPNLSEALMIDYLELVGELKRYDTNQADRYLGMVRHV
ncbi:MULTISPECIES: DUF5962 family protein [Lactobacillales]|uniref:Uncharacterized protein n=1 Tax=Streptococcus equi subsp. equi (strain 4047) TaxID=553482 RepID=C0M8Z8_STRE4|nr:MULTISPECIES: DUF5962 family protein [Streptococcus]ASB97648.1 hypothetical protein SE071780_02099 [Streptococcus equi subsp. equi]MBT1194467.1 hypothetical protein [Streptococcus equi subsp. equi]MBT1197297.1 hypothetical protein [Streptococcus equi subsp. equi]MBT1199902.1 hypothetical protein [Streptococcus equi subsp. equi]MBT1202087.1 hypothetical protein [Streptococcus equi subsp. equi]